jgi:hypothetical protein
MRRYIGLDVMARAATALKPTTDQSTPTEEVTMTAITA